MRDDLNSLDKSLEDWTTQDVLAWMVGQDMGNLTTAVHKLKWSGIELLEIGKYAEVREGESFFGSNAPTPPILKDLDPHLPSGDQTLVTMKRGLMKRIVRLVRQKRGDEADDTSKLHGWEFEKDWDEWRSLLEQWQFSEIVTVKRRTLQASDHNFGVAVLLVSTLVTTWSALTYGRTSDPRDGNYFSGVTLMLSAMLTLITGYLKLSGLKSQLEAAYATHEHQNHVNE
jgi:hypothetical protein